MRPHRVGPRPKRPKPSEIQRPCESTSKYSDRLLVSEVQALGHRLQAGEFDALRPLEGEIEPGLSGRFGEASRSVSPPRS